MLDDRKLFIGGEFADAPSSAPNINPATEEVLCQVAQGGPDEVNQAVAAAKDAFENGPWATMSAKKRGQILWNIGALLKERVKDVAKLETLDNGKPIFESQYVDIPSAADCFQYYAGWATKLYGETFPVEDGAFNYTLREPLGVVAAIVPWNFPLLLASWKVAPALAAGNTVVLKPASNTPLTALMLGEIARDAGLPPGVLNVITGPGSVMGQAMVEHPDIAKIAFTGETNTGKGILKASAETLKRVTLELGGKSPNIVFADANLDAAVKGAAMGIFYGKGEVCAAGSRLLVEESVHDAFVEKLAARSKKMLPSDPMDPKCRLGAIVSKTQMETVLHYIEAGKKDGAKLVAGGKRFDIGTGKGYFVEPTVFSGVNNKMTIAREEIFGPVLAVIPFKDEDEAAAIANDSPYGLAAAVWSRNVQKCHRMVKKLRAGTVWVNTYNRYDPAMPFGGFKQSGFGRELGKQALDHYTETKSVWLDMND